MMKNILDENEINIGDNVTIGQNVSLLCVTHPVEDIKLKNSEFEYVKKFLLEMMFGLKEMFIFLME